MPCETCNKKLDIQWRSRNRTWFLVLLSWNFYYFCIKTRWWNLRLYCTVVTFIPGHLWTCLNPVQRTEWSPLQHLNCVHTVYLLYCYCTYRLLLLFFLSDIIHSTSFLVKGYVFSYTSFQWKSSLKISFILKTMRLNPSLNYLAHIAKFLPTLKTLSALVAQTKTKREDLLVFRRDQLEKYPAGLQICNVCTKRLTAKCIEKGFFFFVKRKKPIKDKNVQSVS